MAQKKIDQNDARLTVFISYSRHDVARADALVTALEARDIQVLIDRRDLPYGEAWQGELADFIAGADTVIWLVSPASVASKWCNWELDEVQKQHKRLVPVRVGDVAPEDLPRQLGQIHILPAEGVFELAPHLDVLVQTLETDRGWLKEHTRLLDRAQQWIAKGEGDGLLLRGRALADAEAWQTQQPAKAPSPSPEILNLIVQSQKGAKRRQRTLIGSLVAGLLLAIGLAGYAFLQSQIADTQRQVAETERQTARREVALSGWRSFSEPPELCQRFRQATADESGFYSIYCHLRAVMSYIDLEKMAGMPLYTSGPHSNGKLRMGALRFGHYNPEMIDWVSENLLPSWNDTAYKAIVQPIYDRNFKHIGRAYHRTYVAWSRHLPAFRHEQRLLQEHVARTEGWKKLATGRFVSPHRERVMGLDADAEWLVDDHVYTATAFWVRRSADGTADKIFKLLDEGLAIYDPVWHRTAPRPETGLPLPDALSDPAPSIEGVEVFPDPWVDDVFPKSRLDAILIFE